MRQLTIKEQMEKQKEWIEQCGGNLEGYIKRYGVPGDPKCYGLGGKAIFSADVKILRGLEEKLDFIKGGCKSLKGGIMAKPASWQDKLNGDVKDLEEEIRFVRAGSASYAYVDAVLNSFEKRLEDLEGKIKTEDTGKISAKVPTMRKRDNIEREAFSKLSLGAPQYLKDMADVQTLILGVLLDLRDLIHPV